MNAFASSCGKTGITYTGRSRKKYIVLGRHAVRAQLPDGRKKKG